MTKEEAIKTLKENYCAMCAYGSQDMDSCDIRSCDNKDAIKASEQEPCEDCISRQAVLDCLTATKLKKFDFILHAREEIKKLPPVTPQPKMGCEGCTYEKTGNNSTYPCSHCSRCYTDKYKAESEKNGI